MALRMLTMPWFLLACWSWRIGFGSALVCHCTNSKVCGQDSTCTVASSAATSDGAACLTYVYDNGTQRSLLCSATGDECPRQGDGEGERDSYTNCCRTDYCNDGGGSAPPSVATPTLEADTNAEPTLVSALSNVPPASDGKLRCDCQAHPPSCKADRATGQRLKAHCVVHNGWCVTERRAVVLFGRYSRIFPPSTHRYCTTNRSVCIPGRVGDRSTLCCSNSKYCNEELEPSMIIGPTLVGHTHGISIDRPTSATTTTTTAVATPNATHRSLGTIWCHCTNSHQCNASFPFCQTRGHCQSIPTLRNTARIDQLHVISQCVDPANQGLCRSDRPCCQEDCCNGRGSCEPLRADNNTGEVFTCHCHNCVHGHRCASRYGCFFKYDEQSGETIQDCLKDSTSAMVSCTPTFALTAHLTNYSRVVGNVHFYCCRGDDCNARHPDHPTVVGQKMLACHCTGKQCIRSQNVFCATKQNGGQCYTGAEGQFCIGPDMPEKMSRLCAGRGSCCNSSFCNKRVTDPVNVTPTSHGGGLSTTTAMPGDSNGAETSRVTTKYESLYIGVAVTAAMVICIAIIISIMIYKSQKPKYDLEQRHGQLQQQQQRRRRHHKQQLRKHPVDYPKSTFDTNPVLHHLLAWQQKESMPAPAPAATHASLALEKCEQQPLQCSAAHTSASTTTSTSLVDGFGHTSGHSASSSSSSPTPGDAVLEDLQYTDQAPAVRCPSTQCPSTQCPSTQCPSTQCPSTAQQSSPAGQSALGSTLSGEHTHHSQL